MMMQMPSGQVQDVELHWQPWHPLCLKLIFILGFTQLVGESANELNVTMQNKAMILVTIIIFFMIIWFLILNKL